MNVVELLRDRLLEARGHRLDESLGLLHRVEALGLDDVAARIARGLEEALLDMLEEGRDLAVQEPGQRAATGREQVGVRVPFPNGAMSCVGP